jgi:hypothetical protein
MMPMSQKSERVEVPSLAASALSAIQQAAISIDHFGLVLEANPAAEALFDDGLYTANRHLIMSDPFGRNAFKALVERLIVPDTDIPSLAPIVVRREGKHPIIAKALQVPAAARNIFFGTRAILILDPSAQSLDPILHCSRKHLDLRLQKRSSRQDSRTARA